MITSDIASYLAAASLGTVGVDIFDTALPESVNNALMVRDYPGDLPSFDHDQDTPALKFPRVQLVARNQDVAAAFASLAAAFDTIHSIKNTTINGTNYLRAVALQDSFYLRQDDRDRHYVVFNARITVAG